MVSLGRGHLGSPAARGEKDRLGRVLDGHWSVVVVVGRLHCWWVLHGRGQHARVGHVGVGCRGQEGDGCEEAALEVSLPGQPDPDGLRLAGLEVQAAECDRAEAQGLAGLPHLDIKQLGADLELKTFVFPEGPESTLAAGPRVLFEATEACDNVRPHFLEPVDIVGEFCVFWADGDHRL